MERTSPILLNREAALLLTEALRMHRQSGETVFNERAMNAVETDLRAGAGPVVKIMNSRTVRTTLLTSLVVAQHLTRGVWSMHFRRLQESIKDPKAVHAAAKGAAPLYEGDPAMYGDILAADEAAAMVDRIDRASAAWRGTRHLWPISRLRLYRLITGTYQLLFASAAAQADVMTEAATRLFAQSLRGNIEILEEFGRKKHPRSRENAINRAFRSMSPDIVMLIGMNRLNDSLNDMNGRLFGGDSARAASKLMGGGVRSQALKEWAYAHRVAGFYQTVQHGALLLMQIGGVDESFARVERQGSVAYCMEVVRYLRDDVDVDEDDYIGTHAHLTLLAEITRRGRAVVRDADDAQAHRLEEYRREAESDLFDFEQRLRSGSGGGPTTSPPPGTVSGPVARGTNLISASHLFYRMR